MYKPIGNKPALVIAVLSLTIALAHAEERIDLARYLGFDTGVPPLEMLMEDGTIASRDVVHLTPESLGDDLVGGYFNGHLSATLLQGLQPGETAWAYSFKTECQPIDGDRCEEREILILGPSVLRYHGLYTLHYYVYVGTQVFQGYEWYGNYYSPDLALSSLAPEPGEAHTGGHNLPFFPIDFLPPGGTMTATVEAPIQMQTLDGGVIEAVPIRVGLVDGPAFTGNAVFYFGYRLGLIRKVNVEGGDAYRLATLPSPAVEGEVVEYINTADFPNDPGGHYFYTADPAEQAWVDAGGAGRFVRTGGSFKTGGYVPVCRFYGSVSPGPNSHFFTADAGECASLKSLQQTPVPQDVQQWNDEGKGFYTVLPISGDDGSQGCMAGTVPVYRAYNNAYTLDGRKNRWDSNHRFSTDRSAIEALFGLGWRDEGIAFCAPQ
jgi:hypothetical protein